MKVRKVIVDIIQDQLSLQSATVIEDDTKLIEDLKADGFDLIEIIMRIEEEYSGLLIPDEEAEKLITVGDIVKYVEDQLKEE